MGENGSSMMYLATAGANSASFMGQMYMGDIMFCMVTVYASGRADTILKPLATQEYLDYRLGGLTLAKSSTAPSTNDTSVITFVNEG